MMGPELGGEIPYHLAIPVVFRNLAAGFADAQQMPVREQIALFVVPKVFPCVDHIAVHVHEEHDVTVLPARNRTGAVEIDFTREVFPVVDLGVNIFVVHADQHISVLRLRGIIDSGSGWIHAGRGHAGNAHTEAQPQRRGGGKKFLHDGSPLF